MAIGQGLYKLTTMGKQVALGTPKVGAGGQILRRITSIFSATRATTELNEIVSHRMSTGVVYGEKKATGKLNCELSGGTYSKLIAAALMSDFAVAGTITAVTIAAVGGATPSFTDSGSGFLTAGFKVGDVVKATGFTGGSSNSNSRNFWITAITAGTITGIFLDGGAAQIADAAGESVTIALVGKKSKTPLTGHTNDFFTFEEWYSDINKSEVYPDCKVNQIALSMPAAGAATVNFDIVGVGTRTLAGTQSFSTPAVETTSGVVEALHGSIYVNGVLVDSVTACSLTIDRGITPTGASVGSNVSADLNQGKVKVTGTFTARFMSTVLQALYDAETVVSLALVCAVDGTALSDFEGITMGAIKLTGDAPDDGEKAISRTYPFVAQLNGTGGAALALDETILTWQSSLAA
jgi:Phage tail tube protein